MTGIVEIVGVHPYAEKFPMLPENELADLADSISANGLRLPIVMTPNGLILDGRNRWRACALAGVEPLTEVYDGNDLAEYVIDANVTRRNMTTGQRAMATALVLEADGRREDGRWRRGSVIGADDPANTTSGISDSQRDWQNRLRECGVVLDYKRDLAEQVVSGAIALKDAFTQAEAIRTSAERDKIMKREKAKREKDEAAADAKRNAEIVADLTQAGAQKYLDLIDAKSMTPKAAWAAHREDTRKERELAEQLRQARSDLYGGIAKALSTLSGYGEYENIGALMDDYNESELNPPQLSRYFEINHLDAAQRLITELIKWRKQ